MPKSKKPKDPHAPKKPLSSYFLFSNERRAVMAKEMPDKKLTELSKLISVEWKELDADTKATYSQRWQEAKAEYATRFAEYKQTPEYAAYQRKLKAWKQTQNGDAYDSDDGGAPSANAKVSLPRKPKDTHAPKRSKTSYFLFGDSVREATKAEHPDKPITEIAKLIGAKWKQLSDEEKRPFSDEAARLKEIYTEQLKRYKGSAEEKAFARRMEEWKAECERRRQRAAVKRTSTTKKGGAKGKTKRSRVEEDSSEEESESGSEEDSSDESGSSEEDSSSDSQSSSDGS